MDSKNQVLRNVIQATAVKVGTPTALSYNREIKDLVFFFKALYGYVDLNINNPVSFIQHGRTRLSQASGVMLQTPLCRTATFQPYCQTVEQCMSRCQSSIL